MNVRRSSSLLGLIGIILLVFAGVAAWLTRAQTTFDAGYIAVNAILGSLALIAWLTTGIDQLRESLGSRSTRYGASTVVGSIVFVAIVVVVNFLSARNHQRFDLTEQGVFSLSPQSIQVVESLEGELSLKAFVEGGVNPPLEDLCRTFSYYSENFRYELLDPVEQPQLAEEFGIRAYNTVRVQYGEESTVVTSPTEENLTNAIIKVTRATEKTVCFVEGHGETDLDDQGPRGLSALKIGLGHENYEIEKVLLASQESVPDQCTVLAAVGPVKPFLENEIKAIDAYLASGGRVILLLRPRASAELAPMLASWGVGIGDDVVVDQIVRIFEGPGLGLSPLARSYGQHEITNELRQITIYPMCRALETKPGARAGLEAVSLVQTSESSWAESDVAGLFERNEASLDPTVDRKGPLTIAVAVKARPQPAEGADAADEAAETRLVVYGSAQFADNRELEGTYYNRDLLLNSFAWLAGEADLLSIRPRAIRASRAQFTPEQETVIFYLSVLLIPQMLLLAGIAVWWRRE